MRPVAGAAGQAGRLAYWGRAAAGRLPRLQRPAAPLPVRQMRRLPYRGGAAAETCQYGGGRAGIGSNHWQGGGVRDAKFIANQTNGNGGPGVHGGRT